MKRSRAEKKKSDEKFAQQHAEIFKSLVKDMARTNGSFAQMTVHHLQKQQQSNSNNEIAAEVSESYNNAYNANPS